VGTLILQDGSWTGKILDYAPFAVAVLGASLALFLARRWVEGRLAPGHGVRFGHQLGMVGLSLAGLLTVVLALPDAGMRGQVLSFVGILLSAAIALSSTTLLGNAMAGIMLRAVKNFRMGDFIQVDHHFGRVTEMGLVHTEIQTEDRDLSTLPNLLLVTHAVKVIRPSGTILSATVSLGYDVPRGEIEECLLAAARDTGLEEPFVHVVELGDFSVSYRAAGKLSDVKHLLSQRSRLRSAMLDRLHEGGIEIVSPTFMNTRALGTGRRVIPEASVAQPAAPDPDAMIFDKAEGASALDRMQRALETMEEELTEARSAKDSEERIQQLEQRGDRLREAIELQQSRQSDDD